MKARAVSGSRPGPIAEGARGWAPGGSLLALKALPLALPLGGILAGRRYTYQWSSMLILAYFAEGATRAWSEQGLSGALALTELALSLIFFVAAVSYARATKAGGHP